jgi:hypothetical protein
MFLLGEREFEAVYFGREGPVPLYYVRQYEICKEIIVGDMYVRSKQDMDIV